MEQPLYAGRAALMSWRLQTGRTHQIRCAMAGPIAGDEVALQLSHPKSIRQAQRGSSGASPDRLGTNTAHVVLLEACYDMGGDCWHTCRLLAIAGQAWAIGTLA